MFSKRSVKTGAEAAYELKRRGDNTDTKLCSYSLSLSLLAVFCSAPLVTSYLHLHHYLLVSCLLHALSNPRLLILGVRLFVA